MTLKHWMEDNGVSAPAFAGRIGRSTQAVRRYMAGERIPDRSTMPIIFEETRGAVTPNDFFGVAA